jgi:hypothetical protein
MKRQLAFILFMGLFAAYVFLSALIVGGCGDGGGGGGWISPPTTTPLATGTFIKTPDLTDDVDDVLPFPSLTTRLQVLYPASEINGSGYIEEIRLFHGFGTGADTTCPNMTVKLGHTAVSSLSTTFSANYEQGQGSLVTVVNDVNFVIPTGASGDEISIPLETAFYYNGKDNLIVEFIQNTACSQQVTTDEDIGLADTRRVYDYPLDGTPDTAGGSQTNANLIKFVFAGGDNEQNFGGAGNAVLPFSSSTPRTQNLYLASEIDGSGPVTGLAFQMNAVSTAQTYTATVRMGHTTLAALGTTYADNYDAGAPVTVANAVTFSIPAGIPAGEWFWVPLPTSTFTYNGTDNLIIDVVTTAGSGDTNLRYTCIANRRAYNIDNANPVATSVDMAAVHIKLRFNGGTIDAGIGAPGFSGQVLENDGDGAEIQSLYHSTELGTGGKIRSISLRMGGDSSAATHANYTIKIGHTAKTAFILADSYASNMDEDSTVYSGTLEVPAGLKAGDWLTIPINSFSYDSTKNLAIYFSTLGNAGGSNLVRWFPSGTRYPDRVVGSETGGSTNPTWTDDGILEIRLGIEK